MIEDNSAQRPGFVRKELEPGLPLKVETDFKKEYEAKLAMLKDLDTQLVALKKEQLREMKSAETELENVDDWIKKMVERNIAEINQKIEDTKIAIQKLIKEN